jgi:hypothetical protein
VCTEPEPTRDEERTYLLDFLDSGIGCFDCGKGQRRSTANYMDQENEDQSIDIIHFFEEEPPFGGE